MVNKMWFIFSMIISVIIELINYVRDSALGIGILCYLILMILPYITEK